MPNPFSPLSSLLLAFSPVPVSHRIGSASRIVLDLTSRRSAAPELSGLPPAATSFAIFAAANSLGLGISAATRWHYHLDLIGTGVFAISAWVLRGTTLAQSCSAGAVALWATKLASFLFYRALILKHDARLDDTLSTFSGQVGFWFISFLWGWLVSLPHTLAAGVPINERPVFGAVHRGGLAIFALGLCIETAADLQKWVFKADIANKGKFCDVGVWKLCQHPNWFGNLLLWTGILLLNAPTLLATAGTGTRLSLGGFDVTFPARLGSLFRFFLASLSPLFLFALFSGQANGVPPLDKGYELTLARFGSNQEWRTYDACTPRLLPNLKSIRTFITGR